MSDFLTLVGYYALSGWQQFVLLAIVAVLTVWIAAHIIALITDLLDSLITCARYGLNEFKDKTHKLHTEGYSSRVYLCDEICLELCNITISSNAFYWDKPPEAVGVAIDGKMVVTRGRIYDFLTLLEDYLALGADCDRQTAELERRVGETLIARTLNDRRVLSFYANDKEYSYDYNAVRVIYTALKENLSKCGVTGAVSSEIYNAYKKTDKEDAKKKDGGDSTDPKPYPKEPMLVWQPYFQTPQEERDFSLRYESPSSLDPDDDLAKQAREILGDIERLRNSVVIACFACDIDRSGSTLSAYGDVSDMIDMLYDIPKTAKRLDFIIDAPGAMMQNVTHMVAILRERFEEITFLVPSKAFSAITAMVLSGDSVIMDEEASLSPFCPLTKSPDGEYLCVSKILKMPNRIKRLEAKNALDSYRQIAAHWLTKYAFGNKDIGHIKTRSVISQSFRQNKKLKADYEKAEAIVKFLTDCDRFPKLDTPLDYSTVSGLGLNHIVKSEGVLKKYMRDSYAIARQILERTNAVKVWITSSNCLITRVKDEDRLNDKERLTLNRNNESKG